LPIFDKKYISFSPQQHQADSKQWPKKCLNGIQRLTVFPALITRCAVLGCVIRLADNR